VSEPVTLAQAAVLRYHAERAGYLGVYRDPAQDRFLLQCEHGVLCTRYPVNRQGANQLINLLANTGN